MVWFRGGLKKIDGAAQTCERYPDFILRINRMESSLITKSDLMSCMSYIAFDMEDLEKQIKACMDDGDKRVMTCQLDAMKLEHEALMKQYENGEYVEDEDDDDEYAYYSALDLEEMARAKEAINACYDI
jgi:hypothetical protein